MESSDEAEEEDSDEEEEAVDSGLSLSEALSGVSAGSTGEEMGVEAE